VAIRSLSVYRAIVGADAVGESSRGLDRTVLHDLSARCFGPRL